MSKAMAVVTSLVVGAIVGAIASSRLTNAPAANAPAAPAAPTSFSAVPDAIGAEDVSGPYGDAANQADDKQQRNPAATIQVQMGNSAFHLRLLR